MANPMTAAEWKRAQDLANNAPAVSPSDSLKRLVDDCKNANHLTPTGKPDVLGYLNAYPSKNPIPRNDSKRFAFWAFKSAPDPSSPEVGSYFQSKACARTRGYQVISETPPGERLESYNLDHPDVIKELEDNYNVDPDALDNSSYKAWVALSKSYAKASRGGVRVFAPDVSPNAILGKDELPALIKNPHVGLENIEFVTRFPDQPHLPKNVQDFLSHDAVRAQVTMDHYAEKGPSEDVLKASGLPKGTPPPHALAHKLKSIDLPKHLQAERDQTVKLLEKGASYKDLKKIPPMPIPAPTPTPAPATGKAPGTGTHLRGLASGTGKPHTAPARHSGGRTASGPSHPGP